MKALVTARKDSKRVPNKNHVPIDGIPLWLRSVIFAKVNNLDVMVDTDDKSILVQCQVLGISYHKRTTRSEAEGGTHWQAIGSAVRYLKADCILLLQPTSPFRLSDTLTNCLAAWNGAKAVYTSDNKPCSTWDGNMAIISAEDCQRADGPLTFTYAYNPNPYDLQIDYPEDITMALNVASTLANGGLW